jgi:hypothetical protein
MAELLGTDCRECIFFKDPKECKLDKISKFEKNEALFEISDEKFMIGRVCNFRRTEEWRKDKDMDQCVDDVKKEVKISGSIIVYADNMHELDECLQNLSKTKHVENFKIIIAHFATLPMREVFDYIHAQEHVSNCIGIGIKEGEDEEINFLDEAFKRAKNGFLVTIDSAKKIDKNILDKLYKYVYEDMDRLLYVPPTDGIHECVVFAFIYKYLRGNKFWTFEDKLKEFTEHQNLESQITSWDEINEKYTD